eukprot:5392216-Prymnesium_polylepis.1
MPSLVACAGVPMPTQDMVLDLYMGDYERSDSYSALMKLAGHGVLSMDADGTYTAVATTPTCSTQPASISSSCLLRRSE